jgi:hypothetical protein
MVVGDTPQVADNATLADRRQDRESRKQKNNFV